MALVCLLHAAATVAMTGIIWFVQLVHYPLFDAIDPAVFQQFERRHVQATTWVVAPTMLLELASAAAILLATPVSIPTWMPLVGAVLLVVIWTSTFLLQVPCHNA